MLENIKQIIDKNKVASTLILVFILAIGYKGISSNIQEGKEKAVLQEKTRLQSLEKEPLNQCIDDIDKKAQYDIQQWKAVVQEGRTPERIESCTRPRDRGRIINDLITSGKMTIEEYCITTFKEEEEEIQKILTAAQFEKDECYRRYK